jgi:hypothetical protein
MTGHDPRPAQQAGVDICGDPRPPDPSSRLPMVPTLRVMDTMFDMRRTDVPSVPMATRTDKPLLAPGNEAEWAKINAEEERQEAEFATSLTTSERLEFGQRLCDQAFSLFNAVRAAGHGPERDPRA